MTQFALEYPFGPLGSSQSSSNSLCAPSLCSGGVGWGREWPWLWVSPAQQQQNNPNVIYTISSTNPKHSPSYCEELYSSQNQHSLSLMLGCRYPLNSFVVMHHRCHGTWWSCLYPPCGTCIYFFPPSHFWPIFSYPSGALCHSIWSSHFHPTMSQEHWLLFRGFFHHVERKWSPNADSRAPNFPLNSRKGLGDFRECCATKLSNSHAPKFEAMN